jgi:hypothetical protein
MSPEKIFDYLDGKLSEADRSRLEEEVRTDPRLQREMAIAREMHRQRRGSREVIGSSEDLETLATPPTKLGRHLITAFAALVFVNVLVGVAFIIGKHRPVSGDSAGKEAAIRQQVSASLDQAAQTILPTPTLGVDEIKLFAPPEEREAMANRVITLAARCGGSAAKALSDATGVTVLADIPADRETEFRLALAPLSEADVPSPPPASAKPNQHAYLQVRIGDRSVQPAP